MESVVNGELSWFGIRDGEFYSDPGLVTGEPLEPLVEVDQLLVDEALGTLERLKAEGTCQIPSMFTASSPAGKPVL